MTSPLRASVVVATRDRPDELRECLLSVCQTITEHDELIVVDSASADAGAVRSVALASGAQVIRTEVGGSARARNLGVRRARGAVIAFTDDDSRVDPDWLDALVTRFSDPAVAAVVGPVFELGSAPPVPLFSFADFDATRDEVSFDRTSEGWFARLHYGAIGVGANLAVHRSAFERYGFFRESLGRGAPIPGDENYYLLTLVESGATVVNEPAARVFHPLQDLGRLRELQRSRIAYLLYILWTRPKLRKPLIMSLLSRPRGQRASRAKRGASLLDLGRALISAPGLVAAARRIDWAQSAGDS